MGIDLSYSETKISLKEIFCMFLGNYYWSVGGKVLTVKADEVLLQTGAFVGVIATNEGWLVVIVSRANSTRFM